MGDDDILPDLLRHVCGGVIEKTETTGENERVAERERATERTRNNSYVTSVVHAREKAKRRAGDIQTAVPVSCIRMVCKVLSFRTEAEDSYFDAYHAAPK